MAEILKGEVSAFSPVEGGFIVVCDDAPRTAVEVYPFSAEMMPGEGNDAARFIHDASPSEYSPTHAAISVTLEANEILNIADREGWRAVICERGGSFHVIEFWLENRQMLELLTPEMAQEYLKSMSP